LIVTPPESDAGVIVAELVDTFLPGGDIAAPAALILDRFGDDSGPHKRRFPGRL
jgi:hypothetical protein